MAKKPLDLQPDYYDDIDKEKYSEFQEHQRKEEEIQRYEWDTAMGRSINPLLETIKDVQPKIYPQVQDRLVKFLSHDYVFNKEAEIPNRVNLKLDQFLFNKVFLGINKDLYF